MFEKRGSIEQDSTKVLILQDPEDSSSQTGYYLDATLEKQRKGMVGMFRLFFDKNFGAFSNVDGSMQKGLPAETSKHKARASSKEQKLTALQQVEKDLGITS